MDTIFLVLVKNYSDEHPSLYKGAIVPVIFNRGKYISLDHNVIIEYDDLAHIESKLGQQERNKKDYEIHLLKLKLRSTEKALEEALAKLEARCS